MSAVANQSNAAGSVERLSSAQRVLAEHSTAIQARLRARFPDLAPTELRAELDRACVAFADARVTAYLPLLAERAAADNLTQRR